MEKSKSFNLSEADKYNALLKDETVRYKEAKENKRVLYRQWEDAKIIAEVKHQRFNDANLELGKSRLKLLSLSESLKVAAEKVKFE